MRSYRTCLAAASLILAAPAVSSALPDPDTTITAGPAGDVGTTSASFEFASSDPDATFECSLDGAAPAGCSSPTTYMDLAEGPHSFAVRAIDAFGVPDPTPATRSWTVDLTPPDTLIDDGPPAFVAGTVTIWFHATQAGSSLACSLDGGGFAACESPRTYAGLPDGPHTFGVRATDPAGNTDASPATRAWTVDTTGPLVTIIRPLTGLYVGNEAVHETGSAPPVTGAVSVVQGMITVRVEALDPQSSLKDFHFEVNSAVISPDDPRVSYGPEPNTYRLTLRAPLGGLYFVAAVAQNGAGTTAFGFVRLLILPG